MRKSLAVFSAMALGLVLLAGCGELGHGRTVMTYSKNTDAHLGVAPSSGTYALYGLTDTTPKISYPVKEDEALGFQKTDNGQVVSVAGQHTDTWPMGTYMWKKQ